MLWSEETSYHLEPFEKEADLESAIQEVSPILFGPNRIYLEVKKLIGTKGKIQNIPDAYLIDLSSPKQPLLWVVENELAEHDSLRHIAVQILQMSLSFEATPQKVKTIIKDALEKDKEGWKRCEEYAKINGFENIDYLLEELIYRGEFGALVVIDELHDELETVLVSRFKFGVEVLTLKRYRNSEGQRLYDFETFLTDVTPAGRELSNGSQEEAAGTVDRSEIDTVVIPYSEDSFLGANRSYEMRLHSSMIPKIKYLAVYQTAPIKAITHIAPVGSIEAWHNTGKYVARFSESAEQLPRQLKLKAKGRGTGLRNVRYTSHDKLMTANDFGSAF